MHSKVGGARRRLLLVAAAMAAALTLVAPVAEAQSPPDLSQATTTQQIFNGPAKDPYTLAVRAYVWGFPLVLSGQVRTALTNPADPFAERPPTSAGAALNNLGFQKQVSDPRLVVGPAPNNDTLYALAWVDTNTGPFVLETPDFGDRYYTFQMAQEDSSTDWSFGRRTHGSKLPPVFISGPKFKGKAPKGMLWVRSHDRYLGIFGRVLVDPNVPGDFDAVYALQAQMHLLPWAKWARGETEPNEAPAQRPLVDPSRGIDPTVRFLEQLGNVLPDIDPRSSEIPLLRQLTRIGLSRRSGFSPDELTPEAKAEVVRGLADGAAIVARKTQNLGTNVNGWSFNLRGPVFGHDWLLRAAVARDLIFVVPAKEALYPSARVDGNNDTLNGANTYRLHFGAGQLPPVGAFWSITMYDNQGFLTVNPINRYSIGDRTPGLLYNPDGSLDITISNTQPATGAANWLPSPAGQFYLVMRLYIPGQEIFNGSWSPPPVAKIG
jgi:hypothetical protein